MSSSMSRGSQSCSSGMSRTSRIRFLRRIGFLRVSGPAFFIRMKKEIATPLGSVSACKSSRVTIVPPWRHGRTEGPLFTVSQGCDAALQGGHRSVPEVNHHSPVPALASAFRVDVGFFGKRDMDYPAFGPIHRLELDRHAGFADLVGGLLGDAAQALIAATLVTAHVDVHTNLAALLAVQD